MVHFFYYTLFVLLGASLASFATLCGSRLATHQSIIFPRSYCDTCKQSLTPKALIPIISFVKQKGRSHCCHTKLSCNYFLTEIMGGSGGFFIAHTLFQAPQRALIFAALLYVGIAFYISDISYFLLPEPIMRAFLIVTLILVAAFYPERFYLHFLTATTTFVILMSLDYVKPESIGGGDIKLLTILGLLLGPSLLLWTIFTASLLGLIIFAMMTLTQKRMTYLAFGPCIFIGALISLFI